MRETAQVLKDKPILALDELREIGRLLDGIVPYRDGHNQRVCKYALGIAEKFELNEEDLVMIEVAALLHDFGKVGVDEEILLKPGPLTELERKEIKLHVLRGYIILAGCIKNTEILSGVRTHHEFWDGSGYPDGLANGQIPLIGRILAVADAYDAMTSKRPYRPLYSKEKAIAQLKRYSGSQFDTEIVRIFLKVLKNHKNNSLAS